MKQVNFPDWVGINFSTDYNCLERLENYGYLTSENNIDDRSRKRIRLYQITEIGQDA